MRWLAATTVVSIVILACGGPSATPTPAPTGAVTPAPTLAPTSAPGVTKLNVLSLWGGSEREAFLNVLDAFTVATGIPVNYETQRTDYATTLQSRITGGNPPDIAIIPGIGFLRRFANDGSLTKIADMGVDVSALPNSYPQGFIDVGTVGGVLYAVPAKYNSKATVWYRPDLFTAAGATVPTDWASFKAALDLLKGHPGALGLGAKDDWTLTDWFEIIYLNQAGPAAYDKLFSAAGDWTDPSVQTAVDTMLEVLNADYVAGGVTAALGRGFVDGIGQAFKPDAEAAVYYEGGFVGGIARGDVNKDLVIGETIDWFSFPAINNTSEQATFGGDVVGAFTNTDAAKAFMQYIITTDANTVWASTGAIVSPNKGVTTDAYPNELVVREAEQLSSASAIRYDGSDLLPAGISGEGMGPILQRALQGQTIDWADFQSRVAAGWASE